MLIDSSILGAFWEVLRILGTFGKIQVRHCTIPIMLPCFLTLFCIAPCVAYILKVLDKYAEHNSFLVTNSSIHLYGIYPKGARKHGDREREKNASVCFSVFQCFQQLVQGWGQDQEQHPDCSPGRQEPCTWAVICRLSSRSWSRSGHSCTWSKVLYYLIHTPHAW